MILAICLLHCTTIAQAQQRGAVPLPQPKPGIPEQEPESVAGPRVDDVGQGICASELRRTGMRVSAADPVLQGACAIAEPISVNEVHTRSGTVRFPANPVMDCAFAAVVGAWTREILAPVTASLMASPLQAVLTGPGYQCRARNRAQDGKMSEHAFGRAIDITGVELADGRRVLISSLLRARGAERQLLDAVTTSACGYFTTVLGPGSDPAHPDHLHVDIAQRRTAEYRICMVRRIAPAPPPEGSAAP